MDADVAVLGAGAAGLAAARALVHAGVEVVVVEARSRVGGRVLTLSDPATPVAIELGAEFLHGDASKTVDATRDHHLAVHAIEDERWARLRGRLQKVADYDARIGDALRVVFTRARRGRDRSFADAVARAPLNAADKELVTSYVEGFLAAPAGMVSTQALAKGGAEGPGRSMRITGGYTALLAKLGADVARHVHLGTTARRVRWSRGRVSVVTTGFTGAPGELRARAAIVALPLGVLRAPVGAPGHVDFEPGLGPAHDKALSELAMGHVVKLVLRFREPFWAEKKARATAAFFHSARSPFPTFWTAAPVQSPVIVAWAGGPAADALSGLDERRLAAIAVDGLADLLGEPRARAHALVEACFFHDWREDAFARGAYAHALVGGATANGRVRRAIDATLFFAGEHTVPAPSCGTVEGALQSGERAARDVLRALGTGVSEHAA